MNHEDIEGITIHIYDAAFPIVVNPPKEKQRPTNAFSAQFSLVFNVAAAIVKGRLTTAEYNEEALKDKRILDLAEKIVVLEDSEMTKQYPSLWPTRITIKFKGGKEISREIHTTKGDPQNPLTAEEITAKFKRLAGMVFPDQRVNKIVETVMNLEMAEHISALGDLLSN